MIHIASARGETGGRDGESLRLGWGGNRAREAMEQRGQETRAGGEFQIPEAAASWQ